MAVLRPITFAFQGSSLTTGRLSAGWVPRLTHDLQCYPEAVGPIRVYDMGKGSQNSAWGVTNAPELSKLKPTHVITEGFGINDAIDFGGGPAITRPQHIINIQTMVAEWVANIPGVDITIQTMSPVSAAGAAIRPALADYYADEIATGTTLGIRTLDNYAAWPHPLPDGVSYGAAVGYAAFGGTWNPADKTGNITLSAANLNAKNTSGTGALGLVRATVGFNAGKHNFAVTVVNASDVGVGIMTAAASFGGRVGGGPGGYGYDTTGVVYAGSGAPVEFHQAFVAGDVISVCVDMTLLRIWWSVNGFCVNGDPVAGIGGTAIAAGTYYPAINAGGLTGGGEVTAVFATAYPGDGLHPLWSGAVDTYLYPAIVAFCRARMGEFW